MTEYTFFTEIGCKQIVHDGKPAYLSPDGRIYNMTASTENVILQVKATQPEEHDHAFSYYRIWPGEESFFVFQDLLKQHFYIGNDLSAKIHLEESVLKHIYALINMDYGDLEISNLCNLYADSIRLGWDRRLSDTCLDVLQILCFNKYDRIDQRLHRLLIQTEDIYFGFVRGEENNLSTNPYLQARLLDFMTKQGPMSSSEIIIATSMLNAAPNLPEFAIRQSLTLFHQNTDVTPIGMELKPNEMIQEENDHGWYIMSVMLNKLNFTTRLAQNICFLDYNNLCIGGSILNRLDETSAETYILEIVGGDKFVEIHSHILSVTERLAKNSGIKNMYACCTEDDTRYLSEHGYQYLGKNPHPELQDKNPYYMKRILPLS